MSVVVRKPISSLTIIKAVTIKPILYTDHKGKRVEVPIHALVYVDVACGVALIGHDHVDIDEDEYQALNN